LKVGYCPLLSLKKIICQVARDIEALIH